MNLNEQMNLFQNNNLNTLYSEYHRLQFVEKRNERSVIF